MDPSETNVEIEFDNYVCERDDISCPNCSSHKVRCDTEGSESQMDQIIIMVQCVVCNQRWIIS